MILFMVLYSQICYHDLNTLVEQSHQDIEEGVIVLLTDPSIHLIIRKTQDSQALQSLQDYSVDRPNLKQDPNKCFAGVWDDNAPELESLTRQEYLEAQSVHCEKSWSPQVREDLYWTNRTTRGRYLQFTPPPAFCSKYSSFTMEIQVFFDCKWIFCQPAKTVLIKVLVNGTAAKEGLSSKPFPRLKMIVFDPTYDFPGALATGYAPQNLIDANGYTSVTLSLRVRHLPPKSPVYDYGT